MAIYTAKHLHVPHKISIQPPPQMDLNLAKTWREMIAKELPLLGMKRWHLGVFSSCTVQHNS